MTNRKTFRTVAFSMLIACFGLVAPAVAQMAPGGLGNALGPIGGVGRRPQQPQTIAPPALPGASGAGNVSAGPVANPNEDPTKLLFEAINHGDYAQVRAAIGRGADLNARNALGETPIELAVELNRNQITFLLLSVRAEEGRPDAAPVTAASARLAAPARTRPAATEKAAMPLHPARTETRQHAAPPAPRPADPGRPDPSAGFLGFGSD